MKLSTFILIASLVQVSAAGFAQKITLKQNTASLKQIFSEIKKQTGYDVFYQAGKVNEDRTIKVNFSNTPLEKVMKRCLEGQALSFVIDERTVLIKEKAPSFLDRVIERFAAIDVRGIVVDENGNPLPGASVRVKGVNKVTKTDSKGEFFLQGVDESAVLQISYVGYKTQEIEALSNLGVIKMELGDSELEEVTVSTGYWTIEKRKNVGNIGKVSAKDIENQPVTSPLLALQGRIAGVEVAPTSGTPGSAIKIQIRGRNSLRTSELFGIEGDGNLPLYVIDGVPINSTPISTMSISLVRNGFDPLAGLNPANIASIEVLKDADATAIYGSRGANGVILITTKNKSSVNGHSFDVNLYRGVGEIPRNVDMLSTEQYLEMRHEAIQNDGGSTLANFEDPIQGPRRFPDLLFWDTTRQTDWEEVLMGETAHISDGQIRLNLGNGLTTFGIGGAYHKETSIYAGDFGFQRYSGDVSANHSSSDGKLNVYFTSNYLINKYKIFDNSSLTSSVITLSPNAPKLYNEDGTLNFEIGSAGRSTWMNPLSYFKTIQNVNSNNFINNAVASYEILNGLSLKTNMGFSKINQNDFKLTPISSFNPFSSFAQLGSRDERTTERSSWIIEPQILYNLRLGNGSISSVFGASFQHATSSSQAFRASGYTSDALLGTLDGAAQLRSLRSDNTHYRYGAVFGRIAYQFKDRYFVNLTGRRDGSSRFGSGNKLATFGAAGIGWIFSNEDFFNTTSVLSFGKIRASYGSTGNDQIGDSKYLKTYSLGDLTYHGNVVLLLTSLDNPNYAWEVTKKLEAGVEFGFFKDRISIESSFYRNRSSNQLVDYSLPDITGFSSVFTNLDATVENKGFEFVLATKNISNSTLIWTSSFNFTVSKNRLVKFPNIEDSPYATVYQIGKPLSITYGYIWKGVDPATGLHDFEDRNEDGLINLEDMDFTKALQTEYFGGINNSFSLQSFELSVFLQFSSRTAFNNYFSTPGSRNNQPISVLDRWQKPGDITKVQKFTSDFVSQNSDPYYNYLTSDGALENIKYIRLSNLALSYNFSNIYANKMLSNLKLFIQGQNLVTISNFKGWDPETLYAPPPLRIISVGLQFKL